MANLASAHHILVKTKEQADDIILQLKKGANFQTLARKHSLCPSKKKGGDLGEFRKGTMAPAFDKAVFKGELLKPIGPVKTKFGFHVIKVIYRS